MTDDIKGLLIRGNRHTIGFTSIRNNEMNRTIWINSINAKDGLFNGLMSSVPGIGKIDASLLINYVRSFGELKGLPL